MNLVELCRPFRSSLTLAAPDASGTPDYFLYVVRRPISVPHFYASSPLPPLNVPAGPSQELVRHQALKDVDRLHAGAWNIRVTAYSATARLWRPGTEKVTPARWSNSVRTGPGQRTLIFTPLPERRSSSDTASESLRT